MSLNTDNAEISTNLARVATLGGALVLTILYAVYSGSPETWPVLPAVISVPAVLSLAVGVYNLPEEELRIVLGSALTVFLIWVVLTAIYVNVPEQTMVTAEIYEAAQRVLPSVLLLLFISGAVFSIYWAEAEYFGDSTPEERILESEE